MTVQEFSDQFDVLYNNITSNQAPGLNEYEKSVFLTKAQDEVVKNYFLPNSKGNNLGQGFDGNAKRQIDFSMLMRTASLLPLSSSNSNIHPGNNIGHYPMPTDVLVYINEALRVNRNEESVQLTVIPLSYEEYDRLMSKPFKRPVKYQAWRLIISGLAATYTVVDYAGIAQLLADLPAATATFEEFYTRISGETLTIKEHDDGPFLMVGGLYLKPDSTLGTISTAMDIDAIDEEIAAKMNTSVPPSTTIVEVIPGNNDIITGYIVRYVARPKPIILTNLESENLSLGGEQTGPQNCELDPILHEEILQRAVELAKVAWTNNGQDNVQLVMQAGQRSE